MPINRGFPLWVPIGRQYTPGHVAKDGKPSRVSSWAGCQLLRRRPRWPSARQDPWRRRCRRAIETAPRITLGVIIEVDQDVPRPGEPESVCDRSKQALSKLCPESLPEAWDDRCRGNAGGSRSIAGESVGGPGGGRRGQHRIRINDQYRICFEWPDGDAYNAEIADYH